MKYLLFHTVISTIFQSVRSVTVTYAFNVSWIIANPDGACQRPVVGINNEWPLPVMRAQVGDRVLVNLYNNLGNESTSLHFHGLSMRGTPHMDGPAQVSQCEIQPGSSFQYDFEIQQPGTYWYHAHTRSQYPDGLRGLFIINDPDSPYKDAYDAEIILSLSDWYHDQMPDLLSRYMNTRSHMLMEPIPESNLINDTRNLKVPVEAGSTYLFRVANIGAFLGQEFWIEDHSMTIVEVDGVYTMPAETNMIYLAAGQRCSFLLHTLEDPMNNYVMVAKTDSVSAMMHQSSSLSVFGWIEYDQSFSYPESGATGPYTGIDDMTLIPYDKEPLLVQPDHIVTLDINMKTLEDGKMHWLLNNISYAPPEVPTLYTALSSGELASVQDTYSSLVQPILLGENETVELVLNNHHMGRHPFHLHGHQFQLVYRSEDWAGSFAGGELIGEADYPQIPIRRDTAVVNPGGNLVLRFKADNPGVWLFHCHMEWHAHSGLVVSFIEVPRRLGQDWDLNLLPPSHLQACNESGLSLTAIQGTESAVSSSAVATLKPLISWEFIGVFAFLLLLTSATVLVVSNSNFLQCKRRLKSPAYMSLQSDDPSSQEFALGNVQVIDDETIGTA